MSNPLEVYHRFVALTDFTAETIQNNQKQSIQNGKQYFYINKQNQIGHTPHSFERMSIDKLRGVFADRINAVIKEAKISQDVYNPEILQKFSTKIFLAIENMKALSAARIKKREQDYSKRSKLTKLFYYAYYKYYNQKEIKAIKLFEEQCNNVANHYTYIANKQIEELNQKRAIDNELKNDIFHDISKKELENESTEDIQRFINQEYQTIVYPESIAGIDVPFPEQKKPVRLVFWRDFTAGLVKIPKIESVQEESANAKDHIKLDFQFNDVSNPNPLRLTLNVDENSNPKSEKIKKYQNGYLNLIEQVGEENIKTIAAFSHQGGFAFLQDIILSQYKKSNLPFLLSETKLKEIHISSTDQAVNVDFTATYSVKNLDDVEHTYAYITLKRQIIFSKSTKQITSQLFASKYCSTLHEAAASEISINMLT